MTRGIDTDNRKHILAMLHIKTESYNEAYRMAERQLANDSEEIDDFRFMGDRKCMYGSIIESSSLLSHNKYIAVAKDSQGNIFYIKEKGHIFLWEIKNSSIEESVFIAKSFNYFLNDFCLGKDYCKKYGKNDWFDFIKSQGWG